MASYEEDVEAVAAAMWAARGDVNAAGLSWPPAPAWADLHREMARVAIHALTSRAPHGDEARLCWYDELARVMRDA